MKLGYNVCYNVTEAVLVDKQNVSQDRQDDKQSREVPYAPHSNC